MITKKSFIVAASLAIGLGAMGQANASVYARSYLDISNLGVFVSDDGGVTPGGATINNFNLTLNNTATLNGSNDIKSGSCSGTPGVPGVGTNNCNPVALGGSHTGLVTPGTRVDAAAANAPGGVPVRSNNSFTFFGPGTDEYANSDSVVWTSELTGDGFGTTHSEQIAEAELQLGSTAGSLAEIQSTTGFTLQFTVVGGNVLGISFDSALNILAAINDPTGHLQTAQANVGTELSLQNDTTGDFALWRPDGILGGGICLSTFGTCTEGVDNIDLNGDAATSTDGTTAANSRSGTGSSAALFDGLYDGDWTLLLTATTSTSVSRVPEPGVLALLGIGLAGAGLGVAGRGRRRAQLAV